MKDFVTDKIYLDGEAYLYGGLYGFIVGDVVTIAGNGSGLGGKYVIDYIEAPEDPRLGNEWYLVKVDDDDTIEGLEDYSDSAT